MNHFNRLPASRVTSLVLVAWIFASSSCEGQAVRDPAPHDVSLVVSLFDSVIALKTDSELSSLPSPDTVVSFPPGSSFSPSHLAVSADGVLALRHALSCTVIFVDGASGDQLGSIDDACGATGRGVSDLFWIDPERLGVFDMWAGEVRMFSRSGEPVGRFAVPGAGGSILQAVPVSSGRAVIMSLGYPSGSVELRDAQSGALVTEFFSPPRIRDHVVDGLSYYSSICVGQSGIDGPAHFLTLNRWVHEVYLVSVAHPARAFRSFRPREPVFRTEQNGEGLSPWSSQAEVACGRRYGIAHHSVIRSEPGGAWSVDGVLDWISFDGKMIARFDLAKAPTFARAWAIGIDDSGHAYGLVRDDLTPILGRDLATVTVTVIRQPLDAGGSGQ